MGIKEQIAGKMQAWIMCCQSRGDWGYLCTKANSAWIFKTVPSIYNISDKKGGIIL